MIFLTGAVMFIIGLIFGTNMGIDYKEKMLFQMYWKSKEYFAEECRRYFVKHPKNVP